MGCHPGTDRPLGSLADWQLRDARQAAHTAFDKLWKSGTMSRTQAYRFLASRLGLTKEQCHIGMFDIATCDQTIRVCYAWQASVGGEEGLAPGEGPDPVPAV